MKASLSKSKILSLIYHNLFDYPLTAQELTLWQLAPRIPTKSGKVGTHISKTQGFFHLKGREDLVSLRLKREKYSSKKLRLAQASSNLLSKIPTILFVGITGSLAMKNARKNSDIDLMIITQKGTLWSTRLTIYVILYTLYFLGHKDLSLRKPKTKLEKNKLCLNIWLDESDLVISDQNIYTAHEIAQIVPLVNKNKTYERFIYKNKWVVSYWPSSVKITKVNLSVVSPISLIFPIEKLSFWLQRQYMKPKRTREIITPTRAFFHPHDWSSKVLKYLKENGVCEKT